MIWKYLVPTANGTLRECYGCPVDVFVPGLGRTTVVYQFQGGDGGQRCAAVHFASGRAIAWIEEHHTGYPQDRAQAAVNERFEGMGAKFARQENQDHYIAQRFKSADVINVLPSIAGVMRKMKR